MSLQIKCLQEMGDIRAALQTAQDMDAQAKRTIHELTPQTSTTSDGFGGTGVTTESDPRVVRVPDAKEATAGLENAYEAAVWAKVTIAALTTLNAGTGAPTNKGNRAGNTGGKIATRKQIRPREVSEDTGHEDKNPARKVCRFRVSVSCMWYQSTSCCDATLICHQETTATNSAR